MRTTWSRLVALTVAVVGLSVAAAANAAEVKVEPIDAGLKFTVDGQPFAEYVTRHGHQPIIWPIIGPGGQAMTRQYPMGDALDGEERDHPHHRSLWFNHGLVNGLDFWLEPTPNGKQNIIAHREFVTSETGDPAKVVSRNDWTSDGAKICEDERTILFGVGPQGRWIDFTVDVIASEGDVTFGDTKEGAFALRVPGTMGLTARDGGKIRTSAGREDAVAWGMSAEWVDYSGPVDGKHAGIVIFDLPDSFRHPTRWHVRDYGLFAANPFGQKDFPANDDQVQGVTTVKKGEKLRLHYRVLFYDGEKSDDDLKTIYSALQKAIPGAKAPE
jgi:hypothetical protein